MKQYNVSAIKVSQFVRNQCNNHKNNIGNTYIELYKIFINIVINKLC